MLKLTAMTIIATLGLSACTSVDNKKNTAQAETSPTALEQQYTFGWRFVEGVDMAPRGGTSKGVPVELDKTPSGAWKHLQEKGISDVERDRRAILAMAGSYKVSFDFVEVAGFTDNYQQQKPYQSWATEKVYVLEDRPDFISLQHILVMQTMNEDGTKNEPTLVKHWRQDWQYQPKQVLQYKGYNTWQAELVLEAERKGTWSQTVYQVDDSPRYGGIASWQHMGNYSSWNSPDTWRPLPRREYSVRKDYQLLLGNNNHIILPTGWVHEQQNNKLVLDNELRNVSIVEQYPVIAREFGYNRYERIKGYDFSLADTYYKNTERFWREIRKQWVQYAQEGKPLTLRKKPGSGGLYVPLFNYAHELNSGKKVTSADVNQYAKEAVVGYFANEQSASNAAGY
jgi:hypothetical protein